MRLVHLIIDSSVVIKWYLPDEFNPQALKLKTDFSSEIIAISVPLIIFYEVNNILRTTTKQLRIDSDKAIKAYGDFLDLNFQTYASKELLQKTLETAFKLDVSSYDASYIALAEQLNIPFYSADEKLVEKAKSSLVLSLEEYYLGS